MQLDGKVAIVTGGGSGLGRASAVALAAAGARVVVGDVDDDGAAGTVAAIADAGGDAIAQHTDVSEAEQCGALIATAVERYGRLDVLHNNAGVALVGRDGFAPDVDPAQWDRVIAVNLSGTFYCCQSAARQMRQTGGGSIVNLSSVGGLIGLSHRPAYTASKHAIVGLTKSLARDLGPAGIRVNALCPGVIRTPMTEQYFSDDTFEQELAVSVPLARYGAAADVAGAALFLASDQSGYLSGVALPVDGGFLAEKSFVSGRGGSSFLSGNETRD